MTSSVTLRHQNQHQLYNDNKVHLKWINKTHGIKMYNDHLTFK